MSILNISQHLATLSTMVNPPEETPPPAPDLGGDEKPGDAPAITDPTGTTTDDTPAARRSPPDGRRPAAEPEASAGKSEFKQGGRKYFWFDASGQAFRGTESLSGTGFRFGGRVTFLADVGAPIVDSAEDKGAHWNDSITKGWRVGGSLLISAHSGESQAFSAEGHKGVVDSHHTSVDFLLSAHAEWDLYQYNAMQTNDPIMVTVGVAENSEPGKVYTYTPVPLTLSLGLSTGIGRAFAGERTDILTTSDPVTGERSETNRKKHDSEGLALSFAHYLRLAVYVNESFQVGATLGGELLHTMPLVSTGEDTLEYGFRGTLGFSYTY